MCCFSNNSDYVVGGMYFCNVLSFLSLGFLLDLFYCHCQQMRLLIYAASAKEADHHIYIWERQTGNLVKMLEGPKESILGLAWHPLRPVIASVSSYGVVYLWSVTYTVTYFWYCFLVLFLSSFLFFSLLLLTAKENWSAFAPDFKELEENVEYIEREDEFDDVSQCRPLNWLFFANMSGLSSSLLTLSIQRQSPLLKL